MIYQVLPDLEKEEFLALRESIVERGVQVPVELDEVGNILDGHHRQRIAQELGVDYPTIIRVGLSEDEKFAHVLSLNLDRRHLSRDQRRELAVRLKQRGWPNTQIADRLKVDEWTVRNDLNEAMSGNPDIELPETVTRSHGKSYPAHRNRTAVVAKNQRDTAKVLEALPKLEGNGIPAGLVDSSRVVKMAVEHREPEPLPPLPKGVFDVIYADPPWRYDFSTDNSDAIEAHYPTLTTEEICSLKIPSAEDAVLFLWATAPKLENALAVMRAWDFEYKTCAVWDKEWIGMGYWFRGEHELLLVGTRGNISPPTKEVRESSMFRERRGEHSRKPEWFYCLIEKYMPDRKYLELFGRPGDTAREGWTVWGNECDG